MRTTQCPFCKHNEALVKNSRPGHYAGLSVIRRRRQCAACKKLWSTLEVPVGKLEELVAARQAESVRAARRSLLEAVQRVFQEKPL